MAKNEVRIISGKWRGRKLKFPDATGLRPSQDRSRETLFNWIMPWLEGARVLDLFAGSGALGFEALSRGAASAELVDSAKPVAAALRASKTMLGADQASVYHSDALTHLRSCQGGYDLIFLDPPYQSNLLGPVLKYLAESACLTPDALVYVELPKRSEPPWNSTRWMPYRDKTFGEGRALLLEAQHADATNIR